MNEKALGLYCILKQWGMPHCPHSLAIYVQTCAHQVLSKMPQGYMNMILYYLDGLYCTLDGVNANMANHGLYF